MARKQRDPDEVAREEIEEALKQGKTELSLNGAKPATIVRACEITTLTELRISGEIRVLPPEIGKLVNLEDLKIEQNKLTTLPKEIGRLTKLKTLWSYSNEMTSLPDEIGELVNLVKWVLWSNKLKTLPRTIGRLKNLEELEVKWNQLEQLPDEINQLANLEELDLESNALKDLPADLSGMAKLRVLKLATNKLARFPLGITTLPALEQLELGENQITEIPPQIAKLVKLRELTLDRNKLKKLPDAVFGLPLVTLALNENAITTVPPGIGAMKKIAGLNLDGNPIENVPAEVVTQGKVAIFEHLGLSKPREVDDTVDPKAVAARKETIEQFVRGTKRRMTDEGMRDQIVAFLAGKTRKVPAARLDDHYSFGHLCEALAPYAQWTFVDRRIIAFITQEAWDFQQPGHSYDTGYHDEFFTWVKKQIETETDTAWFGNVARELVAAGLELPDLTRRALIEGHEKLRHEDGRITSLGRWVVDTVDSALLRTIAKEKKSVSEALVPLLLAHAPNRFEELADVLLALVPNKDGIVHLPEEALMPLCKQDPERWLPLLEEGMSKIGDCMPCRANGIHILGTCYPKRRDATRELATKLLADVSDKKNKEDRYELHWAPDGWDDATAPFIGWMLETFGEAVVPAVMKYAEDTKVFQLDVAEVVAKRLGQKGLDIVAEGLNMKVTGDDIAPHFRRMFTLLAPLDWSKHHHYAWDLAQSEHAKVRETACLALGRLPAKTVLAKATELLSAKKSHQREGGAMILGLLDDPGTKAPLAELLANEKSDDVRDIVVASAFRKPAEIDRDEAKERVASAKERGKLTAPVAKWLDEKKLPALAWKGGKAKVDADTLRFLFQRQTRVADVAPDPEARDVYPLIERDDELGEKLLGLVMKNGGANAKNRFALTVIGLLGSDSVIPTLEEIAIEGKNLNAVATITLLGSKEAARALDRIARVFRTKYPNVRDAAQEGFATIADSMDMTPFELADAMLPDFGFIDGALPMKAGKRALELVLGADLKVALVEGGKVLKTPPKELTAAQKTELKDLNAELKEAARQLRASLEYYLIVQRRWKLADWKAFFLAHPLALAFAKRTVWGLYDGAKRTRTFRLAEDGEPKPIDVTGAAVTLAGAIGLVHPYDLTTAERDAWQAALPEQPIVQLSRPVYTPSAEELGKTLSYQFEGKTVNVGTFKSRAERLGWRRGSVVDAGAISGYKKLYPTDKIEVFVRVDNLGVGFDGYESEATLQDFFFVKSGSVVTGSYTYDEPRDADDPRLLKLADVPAIVLSETFGDLGAIVKQRAEAD
jgi:Leucine-rich repeat (LRR) protein